MKKIILTKDITLRKSAESAGTSGVLLVKQDEIGGHIVQIPDTDIGNIEVSLLPNAVTELQWIIDDEKVYWTSKKITPDFVVQNPSQIQDLTMLIVDTVSVKISWTSPQGFSDDDTAKVSYYRIVVSNSPLLPNTIYNSKKLSLVPKLPGQTESYIVPNLKSGTKYYIGLYSDKSAYGKVRSSELSNVITFSTTAITGTPNVPKRIPIFKDKIYAPLIKTKFNDGEYFVDYPKFNRLAEQDYLIDDSGVPSGMPQYSKVAACWSYGTYTTNYYQFGGFYKVFFELDGTYTLDYIYCLFGTNNRFGIYTSNDGVNYTNGYDRDDDPKDMYSGWVRIDISAEAKNNVKYIVLAVYGGETWYNGFVPYGTKTSGETIEGRKHKNNLATKSLNHSIGTNALLAEQQLNWIAQVANFVRLYTPADWFLYGPYRTQSVTSTNPDDIQLCSRLSHVWNWETRLQTLKNEGVTNICITLTDFFQYLRDPNDTRKDANGDTLNPSTCKPVDIGLDYRDFQVTTNPQSYKHVARIAGALAYRWGSNTNSPEAYNQFVENDGVKGLGLVSHLEFGNESDRYWNSDNAFFEPNEMAAYLSAIYDGHKGALGLGFGIKGADPNMKLAMAGMFHINTDYIVQMKMWWDLYRGKGDYPLDVLNFHHYNSYEHRPDVPTYDISVPAYGLPPEQGRLIEDTALLETFRSLQMQSKDIAVTEMGYDESYRGLYSPQDREPELRTRHKMAWVLRSLLIYKSLGLDTVCHYWYANNMYSFRYKDLGPYQIHRPKFESSGLVDGVTAGNDFNREPMRGWWFMNAFRNALEDYRYTHSILEAGELMIQETNIMMFYSPTTWIFAFERVSDPTDKMIVGWNGVDDWSTSSVKIKVPTTVQAIDTIDFEEQDARLLLYGETKQVVPTVELGLKYVYLALTETPILIKIDNVGTPKLKDPIHLETLTTGTDSVKLSWEDRNVGTNKTRIFYSLLPTSDFAIINEEYRDLAEHTISGLAEDTQYYFKVQFVDGNRLSLYSDTVEAKTFKILTVPNNFVQEIATASTIELSWSYPTNEEVDATNFILYRSTEASGVYQQVASIPINERAYRDFGLVPSTSYYYKIQTYSDGSYSSFSFVVGGTTTAPSYEPPTALSIDTDVLGSSIELVFSEQMKDEQTALTAFTIAESFAGRTIFHPVTGISIPTDKTKVILFFDIPVFKSSVLLVSYSAVAGNLKSIYNYPVNTFSNFLVSNNVALQYSPITDYIQLTGIQVSYNTTTATSSNSKGVPNIKIGAGQSSIIQWNFEDSNGMIVGLDYTGEAEGFSTMDFYTRKYVGKQEWKEGNLFGLSTQLITKGLMRFRTNGTNIFYEHSTDKGTTWVTVRTSIQPNVDLYVKLYADEVGQKVINMVGSNIISTSIVVVPAPPSNMQIDDELNLVSFSLSPLYAVNEHEYCTNYTSFTQNWAIVPSNPISIGDVNIQAGGFAIRVREATGRTVSTAIISTVDITGTINSSSPIMVQRSNGGTVLFGCTTLAELNAWLASANINQALTVQFNTQTTYLLTAEYNPAYTNGTYWVTFQGAAGVRPVFDAQQMQGTVWNIRSYTILRNIELRNANLEAAGATILRADQRHHCKFFDLIFDYGFCCIRATDGGTAGLGIHNFEVDNIIVRNVWGGSFRINGETTNPNCNMSFKNIMLDNPTCDSEGKGSLLPNSTRPFAAGLVLKQQNGLVVENMKSMSGDLLFDMGEIENCNDVVVRNMRGRSLLLLGSFAGNQYSNFQPTGKNFKFFNCYLPNVGSHMNELDGLDMVHCQFKLFIFECKNLGKFRGNIFKEGLKGTLMGPTDMPTLESDNIMIADSTTGRYINWNFPGLSDFYVDESNKATYKLTQGQNSLFVPYANRATLNQNPYGSLRGGSIGKGMITGVLEGVDVDVDNINRVYPTDCGPFAGLRPDQNDQPIAPVAIADNAARTLLFTHELGASQIVVSTNGGAYLQYTGVINVGDLALSANYYMAKIKAAAYRDESPTIGSPAFTDAPNIGGYEVLRTIEVNFKGVWSSPSTDANINNYAPDPVESATHSLGLVDVTGATAGVTMAAFETGFVGNTSDALPTGSYIRSEQAIRTALELNNGSATAKLKFTGLDNSKFYQLYIVSCSQYSGHQNTFSVGSKSVVANTGLSYPYSADGEFHINPAVTKLNDIVPVSGEFVLQIQKTGAGWQGVAINYLIIEETTEAKPA